MILQRPWAYVIAQWILDKHLYTSSDAAPVPPPNRAAMSASKSFVALTARSSASTWPGSSAACKLIEFTMSLTAACLTALPKARD